MMNTRVHIDPALFDAHFGQSNQRGVTLELSLSPYDVPQDISGAYCKEKKKFVIQLAYMGGIEATKKTNVSEHVTGYEGVTTGRLYKLEIDVSALQVETIKIVVKGMLTEAINALDTKPGSSHEIQSLPRRSQRNARVLREVRDNYLEAIAPA